jgi:hypothetical protein
MGAILPFIKSVTAYHSYPKASGFADDVNWLGVARLPVSFQYVHTIRLPFQD